MIGTDGKLKWEQSISAESGRVDGLLLGATANTVMIFQMARKGMGDGDPQLYLIGLSVENGKQRFKIPLDYGGLSYEPLLLKKTDDGKTLLVSTFSPEMFKYFTAPKLGISLFEIDDITGQIKNPRYFVYSSDLPKLTKTRKDGTSENGYMKVHDLLLMNDGGMTVVGEFYSFNARANVVGNMFLLRTDSAFKGKSLEVIEKKPQYSEQMGVGATNTMWVLDYVDAWGYAYTDDDPDGKSKTVVAQGAFQDDKYGVVAITVNPEKGYSIKRLNPEKEKNVSYRVSRAKPGFVMITRYNSKDKTVTTNLEKVN